MTCGLRLGLRGGDITEPHSDDIGGHYILDELHNGRKDWKKFLNGKKVFAI